MPRKCKRKEVAGAQEEYNEEREEEALVHIPKKLCFTKTKSPMESEIIVTENVNDFLIAKKKLQQIELAIETKDVVVLEGPPGCGKTWTMRRILGTKYIDLDWLEYKNEGSISSFLKRCLFICQTDGPVRILIDNADGMQEALIRALLENRCQGQKLYFIFNTLEPKALFKDEEECEVIQLNPLTAAAIKKLLANEVPTKVASEIAEICAGDARVALHLVEEYRLHGTLMPQHRDSSLQFFHSLGKVLYPRKDANAIWQLGHLEEEEFGLFNCYLHFNCLESISSLEDLSTAMDSFSISQSNSVSYLREHPARFVSHLVNANGKKWKSHFGFHKPPSFYFKSVFR